MIEPITHSFELRNILKIIGIIIAVGIFSFYLFFQARFLIAGPQITLENEPPTQNNIRMIELKGTAHNITHLWLNDRPIYTNEDGEFNEALVIENGYTITTLRAKDRYDRETKLVRSFVYTPASIIKN